MMLTHGSLFSGIGGFDLGFERAGIKTAWQVEINPYCRRVLEKHFPDANRFDDIGECFGQHAAFAESRRDYLRAVDVVSGGFPCQDISNAGKRAGIDGDRSGLWREYARIICELRPRYVVVENVAALLHRGMERVLADLAACGYDAEWQSIRASDVGAPHRRERIWIVAYPNGREQGRRIFPKPRTDWRDADVAGDGAKGPVANAESDLRRASGHAQHEPSNGARADVAQPDGGRFAMQGEPSGANGFTARGGETFADTQRARCDRREGEGLRTDGRTPQTARSGGGGETIFNADRPRCRQPETRDTGSEREPGRDALTRSSWWAVEPNVGLLAYGLPRGLAGFAEFWREEPDVPRVSKGVEERVDKLKGLGNSIVPQIAEFIARQILEAEC